jgi:hypothetical protein
MEKGWRRRGRKLPASKPARRNQRFLPFFPFFAAFFDFLAFFAAMSAVTSPAHEPALFD